MTGYYDRVFLKPLYAAFRRAECGVFPLAWRLRARCNSQFVGGQPGTAADTLARRLPAAV